MAIGSRARFGRALIVAAVISAASGAAPVRAGDAARPAWPNIILVGWDTLRADRVGAPGGKAGLTPNLDALARKGSLFTNAVSPASWTLPAFMSWFTSLYPQQHGMTNKFRITAGPKPDLEPHALDQGILTLPQALKARGYRTLAFTGGAGVSAEFGFNRGFDVYEASVNFAGFGRTVPQAMEWLSSHSTSTFFLFVHGYDCHPQAELPPGQDAGVITGFKERHPRYRMDGIDGKDLRPQPGDDRRWRILYDERVRAADRELGKLLALVESSPALRDRTLIVVAGDHGDELFDHGHVDHGMTLFDEVIHVPLVIYAPWIPARWVKEQVRTLDIMPTVLQLAGIKPDSRLRVQMKGVSLVGHMLGRGKGLDAYSETDYLFHTKLRSLRRPDGWKLIRDELHGETLLFDLNSDPGETRNLFETEPLRAYELEDALFRWMKTLAPPRAP